MYLKPLNYTHLYLLYNYGMHLKPLKYTQLFFLSQQGQLFTTLIEQSFKSHSVCDIIRLRDLVLRSSCVTPLRDIDTKRNLVIKGLQM